MLKRNRLHCLYHVCKKCSAAFVVGVFISIEACITTYAPHNLPAELRTSTIQAEFAKCMQAAVTYLSSNGYPNIQVNKEAGVISTDFRVKETGASRDKISLAFQQLQQNQTKVIATITLEVKSDNTWVSGAYTTESAAERVYQDLFEGIRSYISK